MNLRRKFRYPFQLYYVNRRYPWPGDLARMRHVTILILLSRIFEQPRQVFSLRASSSKVNRNPEEKWHLQHRCESKVTVKAPLGTGVQERNRATSLEGNTPQLALWYAHSVRSSALIHRSIHSKSMDCFCIGTRELAKIRNINQIGLGNINDTQTDTHLNRRKAFPIF